MVDVSQNATDDDYYYDDDDYYTENGFDGYIETTIDPGPWTMVVTVAVCLISLISIPIVVIIGERYEKRRRDATEQECEAEDELALKEEEQAKPGPGDKEAMGPYETPRIPNQSRLFDPHATINHDNRTEGLRTRLDFAYEDSMEKVEVPPEDRPRNSRRKRSSTPVVSPAEKSVTFDTALDVDTHTINSNAGLCRPKRDSPTNYHFNPAKSEISTGGVSAMTSNTLMSIGNKLTRAMDKVLIPQYPDDDEEWRTKISCTRSKLSSVVSGTSSGVYSPSDIGSSLMGRSLTILDAGAGAGLRHGRGMTRKPGGYQHNMRKYVEEEDRIEMQGAVGGAAGSAVPSTNSTRRPPRTRPVKQNSNRSLAIQRDDASVATWDKHPAVDDISPNDAADAHDPGKELEFLAVDRPDQLDICCGPNALWKPAIWLRAVDGLIDIADYDTESKRIFKLAIPFVFDAVLETILDNIDVALVANFIGTDAVAAYVVSDLFISMTDELIGGIADAQGTLCPHALGAGNNALCAQYVQIGVMMFIMVSAPLLLMWCFLMDNALLWFGLSPEIAELGLQFTRVSAIDYLLSGISESVIGLLEITDHEAWVAIVSLVFGVIDILAVALLVTMWEAQLTSVAWLHFAVGVLYSAFSLIVATRKGWYRQFYKGLFGSFAFKVSNPLSFRLF